jgi:hypothetical protein
MRSIAEAHSRHVLSKSSFEQALDFCMYQGHKEESLKKKERVENPVPLSFTKSKHYLLLIPTKYCFIHSYCNFNFRNVCYLSRRTKQYNCQYKFIFLAINKERVYLASVGTGKHDCQNYFGRSFPPVAEFTNKSNRPEIQ